jgi:hypothetical protein
MFDWPASVRIDFVVIYSKSIHFVEVDEDQHRSYQQLPEWGRPHMARTALDFYARNADKVPQTNSKLKHVLEAMRYAARELTFHRICLDAPIKVNDPARGGLKLRLPQEGCGSVLQRVASFWHWLSDTESKREVEVSEYNKPVNGMNLIFHNYDLRLSRGLYEAPEPATIASLFCRPVFKDNVVSFRVGTSGRTVNLKSDEMEVMDLPADAAAALQILQADGEWMLKQAGGDEQVHCHRDINRVSARLPVIS